MSKLSQGHIDVLVSWMKKHTGEPLNVSGTWKNNGYEVLQGYQTKARQTAYNILQKQGYEVDTIQGCILSKRINQSDVDAKLSELAEVVEPKQEKKSITMKAGDTLKTELLISNHNGISRLESSKVEVIPQPIEKVEQLKYTADLTPESVQNIAKSLQGMAYTAQLMGKGAKVTISVEMGA